MSSGRVRILFSRLRIEEKLLAEAADRHNVPFSLENVRDAVLPLDIGDGDIFLCRCIGHSQNLATARLLEGHSARVVNPSRIMEICGDKIATSSTLERSGIPQPRFLSALSREGAVKASEMIGYPVVFKPSVGSWGRLLARIEDRDTGESIAEHKEQLGPNHQIFYIQEYIEKPGYDIRAFIIDGKPVCAIRRYSSHWITNTAQGGTAQNHPIDPELEMILSRVHGAIPGDFLAVDCFQTRTGILVNEVNDCAEFRNSIDPTGVDIASEVVLFCASLLKRKGIKGNLKTATGSGVIL